MTLLTADENLGRALKNDQFCTDSILQIDVYRIRLRVGCVPVQRTVSHDIERNLDSSENEEIGFWHVSGSGRGDARAA